MTKHICNKEAEITELHTMVKDIHKALKGNGQPGMLVEFQRFKGAMSAWKWIAGSGGAIAIVALLLTFFKS